MSLTKITNRVIEPGTITANSLAEGVSLGGGDDVVIEQIIITDENFANTENTDIPSTGGYIKLYGSNFSSNANVYLGTDLSLTYQASANVISENEIRVTITSTPASLYNLFVIGSDGSVVSKLGAVTSVLLQATAGWVAGGGSPEVSSVDRITFNNDTVTASARGPLTNATRNFTATGNFNYGWFVGGLSFSTVDRIDFAADTATAAVRGPLSSAKSRLSSTTDNNYGWFGGGLAVPGPVTTVDRIDFAADTGTASIRGNLVVARRELDSAGNSNYGWFGGGYQPGSPSQSSSIERITYVTDTSTATIRGPLSAIAYTHKAVSNENFGWFGGGNSTRVNRIDFAADTATASVRGPFATHKQRASGTDDDNYGWFGGGGLGPTAYSRVDRIDFAADTATSSLRGPLTIQRNQDPAATSGIA